MGVALPENGRVASQRSLPLALSKARNFLSPHVGVHLNNPGHAMPARYSPILIHTAGYVVLALALVAGDSKAWRRH